jgi:membrane associated rhomboid family serine protease
MFVLVPLGSDQSVRRLPWFTILVVAVCFVVQVVGSDSLVEEYAFRPAHPTLVTALASAFIHGGWLHLIGNMLFLWLIGCNLEDRWGHVPFAVLYLLGAIAAVGAFSFAHPGSEQLLVGASGAIAAGMGAFAVTHHGASIRIGYLSFGLRMRAGTFWTPAWVAFPTWFLLQLAFALQEGDFTHVGYSAHVGGFAFGALAAGILRLTGIEKRYLIPAGNKGVEWEEDPEFLEANQLVIAGRYAEARPHVRAVLGRKADHAGARELEIKIAAGLGERMVVEPALAPELDRLSRARRFIDVHELYALVEKRMPDLPLSDRALAQVIHAAADQRDVETVERAMRRLVVEHRDSALIPKALFQTAQAQLAAQRRAESRRTLEDLIARYPMDPIAEQAKRNLS